MATSVYLYPSEETLNRRRESARYEEELLANWTQSMQTGTAKRTFMSPSKTLPSSPTVPLAVHQMMAKDSLARGEHTQWQPQVMMTSQPEMIQQDSLMMGHGSQAQAASNATQTRQQGTKGFWERMKTINPFPSPKAEPTATSAPPVPFPQSSSRDSFPQPRASYGESAPAPSQPGSFTQTHGQYLTAQHDPSYYAYQQQLYQQQQLQSQLLSAQMSGQMMMTVPAPLLFNMLSDAQRSNDLLRQESQQRTKGMRDIVDAVNRHLNATDRMMQLAAREQGVDLFKGKGIPPSDDQLPRWKQQLVPYSPDPTSPPHPLLQPHPQLHPQLQIYSQPLPQPQPQPQLQPQSQLHSQSRYNEDLGLKAEMKMPVHNDMGTNRSRGFWQAPESALSLISHQSSKPGAKWDPSSDFRISSWHLEGLEPFNINSGDFDSISIVASLIHHCRPDILVLTGLKGNGSSAAKVTALLNLWGEEGKEGGTWRHVICPGTHSCVAMLWLESRLVQTWGNDGFTSEHGLVAGLFSLHSRPVLIVTMSEREPRDISSAMEALAAGLIKSHHGLVGTMHMVILPPFQNDPSRQLDDHYEALTTNESSHQHHRHNQHHNHHSGSIFISRAPHGAKTITRDARAVQPISSEGRVGVNAKPPFTCGAVHLVDHMLQRVTGLRSSPSLLWCDLRIREKSHVQEPPPPASSSHRSSLILEDDDLSFKPSTYLEAAKTTPSKTSGISGSSLSGLGGTKSTVPVGGLAKSTVPSTGGLAKASGTALTGGLTKAPAVGLTKAPVVGLTKGGGLESRW